MFAQVLGLLRGTDDSGATAAEYAILAGFIAAVIVVAVAMFGQAVLGLFNNQTLLNAF